MIFRFRGRSPKKWRASDTFAMVIAALQIVLPYVFLIIIVTALTYGLVALAFRG